MSTQYLAAGKDPAHPPWAADAVQQGASSGANRLTFYMLPGLESPHDCYADWLSGVLPKWNGSGGAFSCMYARAANDDADPSSFALPAAPCAAAAGTNLAASSAACRNWPGFQWTMMDTYFDNLIVPMQQAQAARGDRLMVGLLYINFGDATTWMVKGAEYGELVLAAFTHLAARYGFVPDDVVIRLEGDTHPPIQWSAQDYANAIKAAGDRLSAVTWPGRATGWTPGFWAPSSQWMGADGGRHPNALETFDAMTALSGGNGNASWSDIWPAYLTDFSSHAYDGTLTTANEAAMAARGRLYNLRTDMDEFNVDWNTTVDLLTFGQMSTVELQDYAIVNCPTCPNAVARLTVDPATLAYTMELAPNAVFLRQLFSQWKTNAQRVSVESTASFLTPVAVVNPDGSPVVVVRSTVGSGVSFAVTGLPAGRYHQNWTTVNGAVMDQVQVAGPDFTIPDDGTVIPVQVPRYSYGAVTIWRD